MTALPPPPAPLPPPPMVVPPDARIVVRRVSKWFGDVVAVSDVSFTVGPYVWRDLHLLFLISGIARFASLIPLRALDEP